MAKLNAVVTYILTYLLFTFTNPFTVGLPGQFSYSKLLARHEDVKDEYDYVIVGGGTAGLTVADRLTEDGKYTVLVIEHGLFDNDTSIFTVTGGIASFLNATHLFNFSSIPQPNLNNKTTNVIVGNLLGGSSGVNGMVFLRGTTEDYDGWTKLFSGQSTFNWKGLLPYFKKAFTFTPPAKDVAKELNITYDLSYWGNTGTRIFGSFPTFNWPMLKHEVDAFRDIPGVTFPPDSGSGLPGVFWFPNTVDPHTVTRSFARTGHWDGIHRPNYETIVGSKVIKVSFHGRTAESVTFVPSDANTASAANSKVVKARKEIILSAGTIHTPQILQVSGIGPKGILQSANIPLKVELPGVGQNFQDHPFGPIANFNYDTFNIHPNSVDLQTNQTFATWAQQAFDQNKTGPLTIGAGNTLANLPLRVLAPDTFSQIATAYESQDPSAYLPPNSHPTVIAGYQAQKAILAAAMRSSGVAFLNYFFHGGQSESSIVDLHPLSRGTVNIDPKDPFFAQPVVDYRALTNPVDIVIMTKFTRFLRQYFAGPSLAAFSPREVAPGANVTSDEGIAEYIKSILSPSTFHPVGTCAMSPRELGGVVDAELLVYGVKNLRIVDASVIPMLPSAYTQQTTYAIAEKAADLIKASQDNDPY